MARKTRNSGQSGRAGTPAHSRFAKNSGHDLFRRRRTRDLSGHHGSGKRRGFNGVNPVHAGFAILMISFGLLSICLVMLNMLSNLWFASLLSMSGSLASMAGVWMLYDAIKERKSVDNLVRDAIMRVLRDKN